MVTDEKSRGRNTTSGLIVGIPGGGRTPLPPVPRNAEPGKECPPPILGPEGL